MGPLRVSRLLICIGRVQDPYSIPDLATNVGPSADLLPSSLGDVLSAPIVPVAAPSPAQDIGPNPSPVGTNADNLPTPVAFYWLAGASLCAFSMR